MIRFFISCTLVYDVLVCEVVEASISRRDLTAYRRCAIMNIVVHYAVQNSCYLKVLFSNLKFDLWCFESGGLNVEK